MGNVLGVVGCIVLADELANVLSKDNHIYKVFVVDNEAGRILEDKLARYRIEPEMLRPDEFHRASVQDRYSVLIHLNNAGPHDNQDELRKIVKESVRPMVGHIGLCLCFYGLCRNSLWKIGRMGEEVGIPMMILTDAEGKEVDDCFGANIGGKKEYLNAIKENRGTIFVSPGYAENWHRRQSKKDLPRIIEQVENMRFIFERMEYTKVMKLENGLGDADKFEERVDGFSKIFGLNVVSRPCGLGVFENSYSLAKCRLTELNARSLAPLSVRSISKAARNGPLVVQRGHQRS
jgi:hypothetical protein